jgi:hypothetical protein
VFSTLSTYCLGVRVYVFWPSWTDGSANIQYARRATMSDNARTVCVVHRHHVDDDVCACDVNGAHVRARTHS